MPTSPEADTKPQAASIPFVYAFVGAIVPDLPEFRTRAFARAGNLWQTELLQGLARCGAPPSVALSTFPVPSFPRSRTLFVRRRRVPHFPAFDIELLPFVNVPWLKQLTLGVATTARLLAWSARRPRAKRVIFCFNLSAPAGPFLWLAARLTGAKLVASINDINVPGQTAPKRLPFIVDFAMQRWLIPRLDGRLCVADAIMEDLAPGKHYLRVDGGISREIYDLMRERIGVAHTRPQSVATFTAAAVGRIDRTNGFDLLLEAMEHLPSTGVRIMIAGRGPLDSAVQDAAAKDPRLEYRGFLSLPELFDLYSECDALLNIRVTNRLATRYFFPSKLLEYLATGIPVITTKTGHAEAEFGDVAHLLDDETPRGIADAILRLAAISPEIRAEQGRRARQFMLAHRSWDAQAAKVLGYLGKIAVPPPRD